MGTANEQMEKLEKLFAAYVGPRKILIGDESAASRTGLAKTLIDLGALSNHIILASSYSIAMEEMERVKPQVVLCDYDLGGGSGLNLLQAQRKARPESKDSLFVLVTGNTSQSAVAQAAEEDVDTYVIKPYTIETFRQSLMRAAISKIHPSDYSKTVEEGKKLLLDGKIEESMAIFDKAMGMNPKPTLACFYRGQAYLIKTMLAESEGSYNQGLEFNKIHYKCLVGLYELLMTKKMYGEAYDVVKRISRYFPANPQRLASVLRLAIMTQSYDDIESYYRVFTSLDQRNEEITKYICAALVVCGKYYLQKGFNSRALELFSKAATTASGRTKVLREIILALIQFNLANDAKDFLNRFQPATRGSADYLAMETIVMDKFVTLSQSIAMGRKLIQQNVHDPAAYKLLIERSIQAGLQDSADSLLQIAGDKWSVLKAEFQTAYEMATAEYKTSKEPAKPAAKATDKTEGSAPESKP